MIIVPDDKPVFTGLNTYYLDINKVLEHFRGSLGSGALYLRSSNNKEGVVFFDSDAILNSIFRNTSKEISGQSALQEMVNQSYKNNFSASIYYLDKNKLLYWANISSADPIYSDLSSEFTDLEGLIKKQKMENLTGYIFVNLNQENAVLFFNSGELVGASYSWTSDELNESPNKLDEVFQMIKNYGASLDVYQVRPQRGGSVEWADGEEIEAEETVTSEEIYAMLEELLSRLGSVVKKSKHINEALDTLLRKKFISKTDKYPFLDPFAAELEYKEGKIYNYSNIEDTEVVQGIIESVKELVEEFEIKESLEKELGTWRSNYSGILSALDVEV